MRFFLILFVGLSMLGFNSDVLANAQVSINFNAPEKFTDFKTEVNLRFKDRERLMEQLTKLMTDSTTAKLPNNYSMDIVVNNIDMAGTFLYGTNNLYRVVRDSDRIRIEFSYKLSDVNGTVVKQNDVNLSTMRSQSFKRQSSRYKHSNFALEMPLFDKWLKEIF